MATVRAICTEALELIGAYGAGEDPNEDDIQAAFKAFTQVREQWSNERLLHPTQVFQTFSWPSGVVSRTIGTAGNFTTSFGKPSSVEQAFVRDSSNNDYSLKQITNIEYQEIVIKSLSTSIPGFLRYDRGAANTVGTLYLWPVPSQDLTLGLTSIQNLLVYGINDTFIDPAGYQEAITYAVAIRLCPKFGQQVPPALAQIAQESKAAIKRTNVNMDEMDLPPGFGGSTRRWDYKSGFWA